MRRPLSIIYTTFNEIDIIGRSLESVEGWSDDLHVVDSFSTDGTAEWLAARPDVRLTQRAYTGPADQKNWAIARARHEWVLLLDADEVVTPELRREIDDLLAAPDLVDAYWIGRDNYFMGRPIRYSGWGNDRVVRFFHRDRARYNQQQVHEEIEVRNLRVGSLRGRFQHFTFKSVDHFLDKNRRYARWKAMDQGASTPRVGLFHLLVKPVFRFFRHYVIQGGFRDGREGLIICTVAAYGVFLRYVYLLAERRGGEGRGAPSP
ncbi:glycosyltransferase involved in cell wall biosynthesis [Lewinella marina]|uniref:Glycosyl transferase family 2 n=1 Tax=Neolewinella marina TaxID=438751 RepID=A0A2G0CDE5_9BACT|nr:glycosyltransferase family 2 protein [Neolewinella marina]NJB86042.1 glycosyltransferase involved in cell wall biosynthesis [Neolewinella marina]PHK97993.1 glycosyl transferase family 2 [Neolewinella marina]